MNDNKYRNDLRRESNNLAGRSNFSKRDSFSTLFRFSNKNYHGSSKSGKSQDHSRGSNGKFTMKPSIKSIMNIDKVI